MSLSDSRKTSLIGTVALLALLAASWMFVLSPRLGQAAEVRAQADTVAAQNESLAATIAQLESKRKNLPEQRDYAAALAARVPASAAQPELFDAVRDAAARAGIPEQDVSSVTPSVPQAGGVGSGSVTLDTDESLASMELNISVSGSYASIVTFLGELENMPRAYLINTVNVSPDQDETGVGRYTLVVNGTLFVMRAPVDPAAGDPAAD